MERFRSLLWLGLLLAFAGRSSANQESRGDLADLDSSDPIVARRAFEALVQRGDEAALRDVARRNERARHVLSEIEAHRRFGATYPAIKTLSYSAKDRATSEVLADLSKLLGLRFQEEKMDIPGAVLRPFKEKLSLELKDAYPLEILDRLGNALDATPQVDGQVVTLYRGNFSGSSFRAYQRHFSIAIKSYEERRRRDPAGRGTAKAFIRFHVRYDWLCRPAGMNTLRFLVVKDDLGDSLLPETSQDHPYYASFDTLSTQVAIKPSRPEAKKLVRVKGVFPAFFPERPARAEIPLSAPKKELNLPNLTLRLESASKDGAKVRISGKVGDLKKAYVLPEVHEFRLKSKDGRTVEAQGSRAGQRESATWELAFDVPAGFEPGALEVTYFQEVSEHEIPFDFKDVPIR